MIETWGFREDIKDVKAIGLMMMPPPPKAHCAKTNIQISQLWEMIETWGFREDIKDVKAIGLMMMMTPPPFPESTLCKNKNSIFSDLGLDKDLGFSRGHQG